MDVEGFVERLNEVEALWGDDRVTVRTLEPLRPPYAKEWPRQLDSSIREVIGNRFPRPYQHQSDAITHSINGKDVVLESPTASGKTLAFTASMLHTLKRTRGSHALMVYPMKALAFDQREQIRSICQPLGVESWPYDGDVDDSSKRALRTNPPDILLTNPEYLNMSFLGWRDQWTSFLRNLHYVVLDEMHEYRGFFGSNMALLLRRFFLYLKRLGVAPNLFLSTATCANPLEHARNLTGRDDIEVVTARSFRPRRHFIFVDPTIPDYKYRDRLKSRIEMAALACLLNGLRVLVFCPTKKFLEEAYKASRDRAEKIGFGSSAISLFHADMEGDKKQMIQQRIREGSIRVVLTTNALELGLDFGGLDGVIMAGFPPSIMSAWQQIGRAGRRWDQVAFALVYAMNDPIDRLFVSNIDGFLNKKFDSLVIDPTNESLIKRHLDLINVESEGIVHPSERTILGDKFYHAVQARDGALPPQYRPHKRLNMRGSIGQSYDLKYGGTKIGHISELRRSREAYIGAIFTFLGKNYRVTAYEEDAVVLKDAEPHLRTEPTFFNHSYLGDIYDQIAYKSAVLYYGSLDLVSNLTGYKIIDERGNVVGGGATQMTLYEKNRHAFWINWIKPSDLVRIGIGALEHLIRVGSMFMIPADRFDSSSYSRLHEQPTVFNYENYSGGIGIAKKLFDIWPLVLGKGMEIAKNCKCIGGCQNCIEPAKSYSGNNARIDKKAGIELAKILMREVFD